MTPDLEESGGFREPTAPGWMATFGDLMSLLLCFFVLLMSFASMDVRRFAAVVGSMRDAFGVQRIHPGEVEAMSTSLVELSKQESSPFVEVLPMPVRVPEREQSMRGRLELTVKQLGLERLVQVESSDRGLVVRVPGQLLFSAGAAELRPESLVFLREIAELIRGMPHAVALEGHTDDTPAAGDFESNWELSTARAVAAVRHLVEVERVDPRRLQATGFGDTRPRVPNRGAEERAANRRIEIVFLRPPRVAAPQPEARAKGAPAEERASEAEAGPPPAAPPTALLVLEPTPEGGRALAEALRLRGLHPRCAASPEDAIALLRAEAPALVIAAQCLDGRSSVDLMAEIRERWPSVRRVLLQERPDPELARDAVNRAGVSYLLEVPFAEEALDDVCRGLVPASGAGADAATLRFPGIVGRSAALRELLALVQRVARTDSTVLITGETGTGKELISRAIHEASRRRDRAFCAVNSAAFPETLLESELFGHKRGAFTGAASNNKGLFERADKGTVFLDEVGEMPLSMQAKLLRFLQTGEIRAVGADHIRHVDVRLVTATNKNLESEVTAGHFREDLYYRLAVIPIHVPPLRERVEDVPILAQHFLDRMFERTGNRVREISSEALAVLCGYRWPGNVRELENVIERCVALCPGERIDVGDLPRRLREEPPRASSGEEIDSLPGLERKHILETLDRVGWNRKRAAELLQISTTTLWRRLRQFGIETDGRSHRGAPLSG